MAKRKMAIDDGQAQHLATEHVCRLDLRGYRYEFAGVNRSAGSPPAWAAVFDVYTPAGNLLDGPVVFVVDGRTGEVRAFGDLAQP